MDNGNAEISRARWHEICAKGLWAMQKSLAAATTPEEVFKYFCVCRILRNELEYKCEKLPQ